jgi:hypothetical protein
MAGLLDIFGTSGADTMGLLGMSPEDIARNRDEAQAQALYGLAGRLFKGGGGALSVLEGLQQGQQAYKQAMQGGLQEQLQKAQLQEMLKKKQQEEQQKKDELLARQLFQRGYQPAIAGKESMPIEEDGRFIGDSQAIAAKPARFDISSVAPELMALGPAGQAQLKTGLELQKSMAGETFKLGEGEKQYQRNPLTGEIVEVAAGAPKEKATPAELQGYNFAVGQGYKGSFLDYQTALKRAGATNVNVGEKSFGSEFGKGVAEAVNSGYQAATGAVGTLNRIQTLKPLVSDGKVFSGTLGNAQVQASRMADALGIGGATNAEKLQNTALAMQQLSGLELTAAEAMKGQGAITENERGLIKRAAGGDLMNMTAKEVSTLLDALEKTSNYKIQIHETNLKRLGQNKDLAPLAEYYKLPQTQIVEPSGLPVGVTVRKK